MSQRYLLKYKNVNGLLPVSVCLTISTDHGTLMHPACFPDTPHSWRAVCCDRTSLRTSLLSTNMLSLSILNPSVKLFIVCAHLLHPCTVLWGWDGLGDVWLFCFVLKSFESIGPGWDPELDLLRITHPLEPVIISPAVPVALVCRALCDTLVQNLYTHCTNTHWITRVYSVLLERMLILLISSMIVIISFGPLLLQTS